MIEFIIGGVCLVIALVGFIFFGLAEEGSAAEDACGTIMILGFISAIVLGIAGVIAVTTPNTPDHTRDVVTQFNQLYPTAVNPVLDYDRVTYKSYTSSEAQLCTIQFVWDDAHKVAVWQEPQCGKIVG